MAGFGIDGIISGLDTTSLINALISAEAGPQRILANKRTAAESLITAWQSLNTKIAALTDRAKDVSSGTGLQPRTVTSTEPSVTATAADGAGIGDLTLVVSATAQTQTSVTAAMTRWAADPAVLTVRSADGTLTEISAAGTDLDAVAAAVNTSEAGVRATKVPAGTDPDTGETRFRLQFTSTESGATGAFEVFDGDAAAVTAGTAENLFERPGAAHVRTAADAVVTLWAGTAAEQQITSATNTFVDLMPGVDLTVGAASTEPVTITVSADVEAQTTSAKDLVAALAAIFGEIATRSRVTSSTGASGQPVVTGGLFAGESTVRDASARLLNAATAPVGGRSPSEIGLVITRDGTVEFDEERFREALAADPDLVTGTLAAIGARVAEAGEIISAPKDGLLSARISGQESQVADFGTQIAEWDRRLASRRETLQRTYTSMEVALSRLQSQQSYLTAQLASFATSASSS
ncbi:flagellar filament capping protein FliD [Occultella aeris]|uniref:Flagellar hook-associated protein 2 n=1 Tax=Occultella aeris TaxID=2761496 RepID=A0A7M4DDH9_9MICO|nr:flagellar filament capping protein FliD [Occultella aeris]VZO34898.1 Flagellar hook-associated protein 2 [Occultella aeris]